MALSLLWRLIGACSPNKEESAFASEVVFFLGRENPSFILGG